MSDGLRGSARAALRGITGVAEGLSVFSNDDSDPGYWVDATMIAHFVGEDGLELRLTKGVISANRGRLKADERVTLKGGSDWLLVRFRLSVDVDFIAELGELAAEAHRPPSGVYRPPPEGVDLARRRRFH